MAKNKGKKNVEDSVVETTKVKTGETTDLGFIKALKAKGIDAKAKYPAETLRDQLNSLDEKDVSFLSTNEVVLDVINGDSPVPPTEKVTVTVNVDGLDEGDNAYGAIGEEAIQSFPASIERNKDTVETLEVTCEGYVTVTQDVTFDKDKEITVTLEKEPVEDITITVEVNGLEEGDEPRVTVGDEVLTELPAEVTRPYGTVEQVVATCEGYVTQELEVEFTTDGATTSVYFHKELNLVSAAKLDVSGATEDDNPGIAENGDKYEVAFDGNTITVTDNGLIPYIGGNIDEPKKWIGLLVDFGVKVQATEESGYTIEDVDYSDAARWGAQTDTTFIMWITDERLGESFSFYDEEDLMSVCTIETALSR